MKTLKNFTEFLIELFHRMWNKDEILADSELVQKRREICADCDRLKKHWYGDRCGECGCFIKTKTKIKFESCPIDKW